MAVRRSQFGSIRKLPSGKFQASYPGADGKRIPAPTTFARRGDASAWLANVQADITRGVLRRPKSNKTIFADYAEDWLTSRPKPLRETTLEDYRSTLRLHVLPTFGRMPIAAIEAEQVRAWFKRLGREVGPAARAKAYARLHAIMATAAEDDDSITNPCKIPKGGATESAERIILDPAHVATLADHMLPHYRTMVLVGMYGHLRHGELIGLTRSYVDLAAGSVTVWWQLQRIKGQWLRTEPKSKAGRRVVHLPPAVVAALADHLAQFVLDDPDAPVFATANGNPIHRGNYDVQLKKAGAAIGRPDLHSHLLRHSGLTLAGQSGATTKELLTRGGHTRVDVAMTYQHSTTDRDRQLATRMDDAVVITHKGI